MPSPSAAAADADKLNKSNLPREAMGGHETPDKLEHGTITICSLVKIKSGRRHLGVKEVY